MPTATLEPPVSRHKCLIYDGHPSTQLTVVTPLLVEGLQDNWRCLYLGSPQMVTMTEASLKHRGIDTAGELQKGSLILSSDRSHLAQGKFDPYKMVDGLCQLIDESVQLGYQGLCATGDMRWELGDDENFERLLEYEALLEQVFREKPLTGICQYHRDVLPGRAVREALLTHRSTYIGDSFNPDNWFFMPPELILGENPSSAAQGEWMCQQILRVQQAERKRDLATAALAESEGHQRQLAERLAEMNRDLDRRVAERTAQLEAANKQLEAFSYSVSHDLRSPLTSILGFADLLQEEQGEALGARGRERLAHINTSGRRMGELIEALLALGRLANADLQRSSVDLTALAWQVSAEVRQSDPERSAEWIIQDGLSADGDPVLLRAVLANLLRNAWKFTSKCASPRIEVGKLRDNTGQTVFFVRDNGAGFENQNADDLFRAFKRLHKQEAFPGTGIGLATVQGIIARHGGTVWGEGRPNQGATFFFTIPDAAQPAAEEHWLLR